MEFRTARAHGDPEALLGRPKSRVHSDGRLVWVKREVRLEVTIQELAAIKASNLKVWPWQNLGQQPGNPQHGRKSWKMEAAPSDQCGDNAPGRGLGGMGERLLQSLRSEAG